MTQESGFAPLNFMLSLDAFALVTITCAVPIRGIKVLQWEHPGGSGRLDDKEG